MTPPLNILICEDNEFVLQITGFALEAEGFKIEMAKNTDEIFHKLTTNIKPSLILLDLNLPENGGAYVLSKLKNEKETKNIPVVLFSGEANLAEIAANLNADGYIQKPFEVATLIETVKKYVHPQIFK